MCTVNRRRNLVCEKSLKSWSLQAEIGYLRRDNVSRLYLLNRVVKIKCPARSSCPHLGLYTTLKKELTIQCIISVINYLSLHTAVHQIDELHKYRK